MAVVGLSASVSFSFDNEEDARVVGSVLSSERVEGAERSSMKISVKGKKITATVAASDAVALRASLNTLLRIFCVSTSVIELKKTGELEEK